MNAIIKNPSRTDWPELMRRPEINSKNLETTVLEILNAVKAEGDIAVKNYSLKFHGFAPDSLWVTEEEIAKSPKKIDKSLKKSILLAKKNIEKFHKQQFEKIKK
jgi:histidinol dehydrogenase